MNKWIQGLWFLLSLCNSFLLPSVLQTSHGSSKLQLRPLVREEREAFAWEPSTLMYLPNDELGVTMATWLSQVLIQSLNGGWEIPSTAASSLSLLAPLLTLHLGPPLPLLPLLFLLLECSSLEIHVFLSSRFWNITFSSEPPKSNLLNIFYHPFLWKYFK